MFQGQVIARVGAFFRIAFPKIYRAKFEGKIIITYGFENSLIATTEKKWEDIFKKDFEYKSLLSERVRDLKRVFLGGITNIDFDNQGRFILPEFLRDYSQIKVSQDAVFVWQRDYIEVWDKTKWEENLNKTLKNLTVISEKLSRENLDGRIS